MTHSCLCFVGMHMVARFYSLNKYILIIIHRYLCMYVCVCVCVCVKCALICCVCLGTPRHRTNFDETLCECILWPQFGTEKIF